MYMSSSLTGESTKPPTTTKRRELEPNLKKRGRSSRRRWLARRNLIVYWSLQAGCLRGEQASGTVHPRRTNAVSKGLCSLRADRSKRGVWNHLDPDILQALASHSHRGRWFGVPKGIRTPVIAVKGRCP